MNCCHGHFLNSATNACEEICGDGLLFVLGCDDGNMINGDGCSINCTVEDNYVCVGGNSTHRSVCGYSGSASVSLLTAFKIPTSNSLNLTFSLDSASSLLSFNNQSSDFTALVSFPGSDLNVSPALMDGATSRLVVYVDYFTHLQDQDINFLLVPPDVPAAFATANATFSWVVQATNQLAVYAYSVEEYK